MNKLQSATSFELTQVEGGVVHIPMTVAAVVITAGALALGGFIIGSISNDDHDLGHIFRSAGKP